MKSKANKKHKMKLSANEALHIKAQRRQAKFDRKLSYYVAKMIRQHLEDHQNRLAQDSEWQVDPTTISNAIPDYPNDLLTDD
jgi:hypothetical protein